MGKKSSKKKSKKSPAVPKALFVWEEKNVGDDREINPSGEVLCVPLAEANSRSLQSGYADGLEDWSSLSTVVPRSGDGTVGEEGGPSYVIEYISSPLDLSSSDRLSIYNLFIANMGDMYKRSAVGLNESEVRVVSFTFLSIPPPSPSPLIPLPSHAPPCPPIESRGALRHPK